MNFQTHINGLRAIAVVSVILYHLGLAGFGGGFVGVDIFLVISGYLLTNTAVQQIRVGTFSFATFYINRLRRVAPALACMVLTCTAWGFATMLPDDLNRLLKHAVAALHYTSNFTFANEAGYFDTLAAHKPLVHTWSLALEAQFYLLLPILMTLLLRSNHWRAFYLLLLCASFITCLWATPLHSSASFYLLPTRLWEFMLGGALALFTWKPRQLFHGIGCVCIALSVTLFSATTLFPGYAALLPAAGAALFIAGGNTGRIMRVLAIKPLQYVGTISYSLYLWHWPIYLALHPHAHWFISLIVLLGISSLSYHFIEQPFRTNKAYWNTRRLCALLLAVIMAAVALKTTTRLNGGFPERLPEYIQRAGKAGVQTEREKACFRDADGSKKAKEEYCRMGADATPSVVLWGDSHANQLHAMLDEVQREGKRAGLVATSGGCVPSLGVEGTLPYGNAEYERIYPTCHAFNRTTLAMILENPHITTVIIAAQWPRYESTLILHDLGAIATQFAAKGKRLLLVGPVPMPVVDVPRHWARVQMEAGHALEEIIIDAPEQAIAVQVWREKLQTLAKAHSNITLIDPARSLCEGSTCYMVRGGKAYFSDTAHLSHDGAWQLKPLFSKLK